MKMNKILRTNLVSLFLYELLINATVGEGAYNTFLLGKAYGDGDGGELNATVVEGSYSPFLLGKVYKTYKVLDTKFPYSDMATGMFKNYPTMKGALQSLHYMTNCNNYPQWEFVIEDPALPAKACALPTWPSIDYLLDVYKQLIYVKCSNPKDCSNPGCDPYMSVFRSRWLCYPKIRKPNLKNWHSDQAFASTFINVSFDSSNLTKSEISLHIFIRE